MTLNPLKLLKPFFNYTYAIKRRVLGRGMGKIRKGNAGQNANFFAGWKFRSRIAPLTNWKPLIKVTGSPNRTRDALCIAFYAFLVVFVLLEVSQARMLSTDFATVSQLKCQHACTELSKVRFHNNLEGNARTIHLVTT